MTIRSFVPVFLTALLFFVLVLELVDLFANLWRYVNNDVALPDILKVALLYVPKCVSFSLPIAVLFAVSFCLGGFHSNNELIAVFGSGISLRRFVLPLVAFGLAASIAGFFFEDTVVIRTFRLKNEVSRNLLNESQSLSRSRPTVLDDNNRVVYHAEYYNDNNMSLSRLTIVERDDRGGLARRIDCQWAEWKEDRWVLHDCRIFTPDGETGRILQQQVPVYDSPDFTALPESFKRTVLNVQEMPVREADAWIRGLIRSGLPYRSQLTEYYKRFSFALTPLVVALISSAIGGRFRKNILLMSLLTSLSLSVVYYVMQMVLVILANHGYITPLAGAWIPFIFFSFGSLVLFRFTRS